MTYIRWLHGLEFARPVRKLFIPLFPTPQNCEYIAYHSRRLCYIMPDRNNLAMLDFETGKRSIFSKDTGGILLPSDCLIAILFGMVSLCRQGHHLFSSVLSNTAVVALAESS